MIKSKTGIINIFDIIIKEEKHDVIQMKNTRL